MHIPRIIHQTARSLAAQPPEIHDNIERIKALNPGWEYRFYDHDAVLEYLREALGGEAMKLCERVNPRLGVVLSDLFRYVVIHREGGVYFDIKAGMTKPLDEMIRPDDVFLLSQWRNHMGDFFQGWGLLPDLYKVPGGEYQQWHVIAAPGHPYLAQVIEDVLRNMRQYTTRWFGVGKQGVVRVSGPIAYTLAIAPIQSAWRHRIVDIEALGLHYSMYRDPMHHMRAEGHYLRVNEPVMLPDDSAPDPGDIFRKQQG